jgi:hypothetical protein
MTSTPDGHHLTGHPMTGRNAVIAQLKRMVPQRRNTLPEVIVHA